MSRLEKSAGGFACTRGKPADIAREQVERVDLVERVAGLALALEHERLAVAAEVTFTAAGALEDELAGVLQEGRFLGGGERRGKKKCGEECGEGGGVAHSQIVNTPVELGKRQARKAGQASV